MTAVAGIRAELKVVRAERAKATIRLDEARKALIPARVAFEHEQEVVVALSIRVEKLTQALRFLGDAGAEQ